MYGVKILNRNGTRRPDYCGSLLGFCHKGDWRYVEPFTVATLAEAEEMADKMQRNAKRSSDVRYIPCPLPSIQ